MGLSLRSSLHLSHFGSGCVGLNSFSTLPTSTPPTSVMRTSDFSVLPSSSIVFHRPTGVDCAKVVPAATASVRARAMCFTESPLWLR